MPAGHGAGPHVAVRPSMSGVNEFASWWVAQLRDLVPGRLTSSQLVADALIIDVRPNDPSMALIMRRNGRETPLGPSNPSRLRSLLAERRPRRVLLRVAPGVVLERPLVLPAAAEAELGRVVAWEIDRISPFTADEVAWTWVIDRRDRVAGRLHLTIAMLPRAGLAQALTELRDAGVTPAAVLAPRPHAAPWSIALSPTARSPGSSRALVAIGALCAVLAVVTAALPFVMQEQALGRVDAQVARLRPAVAEADTLRSRISERAGGRDAVAAEAARVGQALNLLSALTALLPDDTYLTALSVRQRVVTISGRSASATRLLPLLAADPSIRNAAFAAPVTRAEAGRFDVFSIRAELGS